MGTIISTWRMSLEGVEKGKKEMLAGKSAGELLETVICEVENNPTFISVGYGGLPNEEMEVELDAAYMDGDTLDIGCVAAMKNIANPFLVAKRLSQEKVNCVLVGEGAEQFALKAGFEKKDMLTENAKQRYLEKIQEEVQPLKPYIGHDTIGCVALDHQGKIAAGTSTSGLFMKKKGRVGDSPLVGSGFYADSQIGGACATGLGEDLMKGCISYEIVRLMKEGMHPQAACEKAVNDLNASLIQRRKEAGDLSVIAVNKYGEYGAATNIEAFSFVAAQDEQEACVYRVMRDADGHCTHVKASQEWIDSHLVE